MCSDSKKKSIQETDEESVLVSKQWLEELNQVLQKVSKRDANSRMNLKGNSDLFDQIALTVNEFSERFSSESIFKHIASKILNAIVDMMVIVTDKGEILIANDNFCRMVEKPQSQLIGTPIIDLLTKSDQFNIGALWKLASQGPVEKRQLTIKVSNEMEVPVHANANIIEDDKGGYFGLALVFKDLRQTKLYDEAIERESYLRTIFDALPIQIIHLGKQGEIKFANRLFRGWYSHLYSDFNGISFLDLIDATMKETFSTKIDDAKIYGHTEFEMTFKESEIFNRIYQISCTADYDRVGEIKGTFVMMIDITERVQTKKELQQTQSQLIQSAKLAALGEMGAGLAHELNNPLFLIRGFSSQIKKSLLKAHLDRKKLIEFNNEIFENSKRMKGIIQQFRDFSRQSSHVTETINVVEVIKDSLALFNEQLKLRNIKLLYNYVDQSVYIDGAYNRLEQVFVNLIGNARDSIEEFHGNKGGVIKITVDKDESDCTVLIEDNGMGIAQEKLTNIFNPFFTTKKVGRGTGLGLSISHGIIKDHRGTIECQSQEGKGCLFVIKMPLKIDAEKSRA